MRGLPGAGFHGANVTIPHKEAALALATDATDRARAIGAANTLLFRDDGQIWADNTDAPALIEALERHVDISTSTAVILGAGGTARAATWALTDANAKHVSVWNRTTARARELAASFGAEAVERVGAADVLINCTSVGLHDGDGLDALMLHPGDLANHRVVVDFVYSEGGTPLTRAARESGLPTIDGLELLIGQGAIAFELFTGKTAPRQAMRDAVGLSSAR